MRHGGATRLERAPRAGAVGFEFHGAKTEEGSEPDTGNDGWTGYAPLADPPAELE